MRIKRLEIHGFKSFMDKTTFHFGGGMTAVVGPNGCGKSNIVDAILWCMGEQSPKHLRGKEMADVIFAGSESRPPAGLAEVSLIFSVDDLPSALGADVPLDAKPVRPELEDEEEEEGEGAEGAEGEPEGELVAGSVVADESSAGDPAATADGGVPEAVVAQATATMAGPSITASPLAHLRNYTEIQVTRRLYRSGESEYLMNKTTCRLRDIHELFMDAGIGKGAYSIIEQGKVGMIVSAKPEDRRIFIEEAAGIAKFKSKKRQALSKMEQTEQNLLRLNDIVTELAKQMGSLERQAKKAERYRKLRDEIREVDLKVAAAEFERRTIDLGAEQAALAELKEREAQGSGEIAGSEADIETTRETLVEDEKELGQAQERLFQLNNEVKLAEQNLDYAVRELEKLKALSESATVDIARLEGDVQQIDQDAARAEEERVRFESELSGKAEEIERAAERVETSKAQQKRLLQRVDEVKSRIVEAMQVVANARNSVVNLEKRSGDLRTRLERGEGEREEVADRVSEARRAQDDAASALNELKQLKLGLEQQKGEQAALVEQLRLELKEAESQAKRLGDDLSRKKSRLQSLTELQNSYEGYHKGVRAVMERAGRDVAPLPWFEESEPEPEPEPEFVAEPPAEPVAESVPVVAAPTGPLSDGGATLPIAADGVSAVSFDSGAFPKVDAVRLAEIAPAPAEAKPVPEPEPVAAPAAPVPEQTLAPEPVAGVFGLVTDYLDTPQRFETALEAVLGDRLQAVLVGCHTDGAEAISFLMEKAQGRGTFIPLDLAAPAETAFPSLDQPGIVGRLLDQVQVAPEFQRVARFLLGDVIVVESLERAVELHKAHRTLRKTWVTLDGGMVDPAGVLTGGSSEGLTSGLLQRKREIRELTREVSELEKAHANAALSREQLARRLAQVEESLKGLQKSEHEEALRILHHEKDLAALRERLDRDRQRQEVLEFEAEQLRTQLQEIGEEKAEAEARIQEQSAAKEAADAELLEAQEAARGVSEEIEALVAAETQAKVGLAEARSRRDAAVHNLERLERNRIDLEGRLARLKEQLEKSAAETVRIQADAERLQVEIDEKAKAAEELRMGLLERREKFDGESLALREREAALKGLRQRLQEMREAITTSQLRENELAMNLRHANQQVMERYNEDLEQKWREWLDPQLDFEAARAQVVELKERIAKLGEVNMGAIEELAEVSQRHEFLAREKGDLEQTLAQLRDTIAKINRTSKERFLDTFEKVNARFQELYPKLFRGGKAHLVLTNGNSTEPVVPGAPGTANADLLEAGIDIVAQPPGKKLQNINLLSGGEKALTAVSLIMAIFQIRPTPFCILDEVDAPLDEANVGRYNDIVREMSNTTQFIVITHNKRTMGVCDALYGITMEEPGCSKTVSVRFDGEQKQRTVQADA